MEFTLSFEGNEADNNLLDFYDAAQAMAGFQRSLALTTHLIINGEIITQAPSLKNAEILVYPPEAGSWRAVAIVGGVLLTAGVASKDSVVGHLLTSAYDYVISESLGFHVDFDKSLGQLIEDNARRSDVIPKGLDQGKFEALIEKSENSIKEMHRPISHSHTAREANIGVSRNGDIIRKTGPTLDLETFGYINVTNLKEEERHFIGRVSSYNSNTFKGRIYNVDEGRPVPFTLAENARTSKVIQKIVRSLSSNAMDRFDEDADIRFSAFQYESKNARLKGYLILNIF